MTQEDSVQVVIRAKNAYGREFSELRRELTNLGSSGVASTGKVSQGLQQMGREASGLKQVFSTLGREIMSTAAGFLVRDIVIGSWQQLTQSISRLGSELIGINRQWETFGTRYYVQLGRSQELAEQRMREIEEFARATPFELAGIIEADQQLQIFGLHSQQAARRFGMSGKQIREVAGDIAAGTKASFEEIAMWLGRFASGDTGQAIRRFQELGVVTREELRAMGVEFDNAGGLTTPVEEAFSALLRTAERKFGGLMEIQAATLQGVESNVADFMTTQKRLWGEPLFDAYRSGLQEFLTFINTSGATGMLDAGRNMWTQMIGGMREGLGQIAVEAGMWVSEALLWGENIAVSLAEGIGGPAGIMYVGRAVGNLGREIQRMLEPGSPPELLPELTNWGAGAAAAWLEGWADASPSIAPYLQDLMRSLEPYLQQVEGGGDWDVEGFRGAFGGEAKHVEGYVWAFQRVHRAVQETALAREDLTRAEETGSAEEIAAAQKRLTTAKTEESQARSALQAEQQRISQRISSETDMTKAIREQTAAITQQARVSEAANSAREEAAARQLAQARLQLELTEAETPVRQLEIWRRELAATQQGTVEWYQTRTTIVRLEQQIRREQEQTARGASRAVAESIADQTRAREEEERTQQQKAEGLKRAAELEGDLERQQEEAARRGEAYDPDPVTPGLDAWWAVGKAIAGRLWDGFEVWARARWDAWASGAAEWAASSETVEGFMRAGRTLGSTLGSAIAGGLRGLGELRDERARVSQYWAEQGEEELARAGGVFSSVEQMLAGDAEVTPTLGQAMAELAGTLVAAFFDAFAKEFEERGGFLGLLERARLGEEGFARLQESVHRNPEFYTGATQRAVGYEPPPRPMLDEPVSVPGVAMSGLALAVPDMIQTLRDWFSGADPQEAPEVAEFGSRVTDEIMLPIETNLPDDLQVGVDTSFSRLGTASAGLAGARLGQELMTSFLRRLGLAGTGREPGVPEVRGVDFFAKGTSFAPGGLAVVGEEGPELISLPRGSQVYSAERTREALSGGQVVHNWSAGAIQINVTGGDPEKVRGGVLSALRAAGVTP